MVYLLVFVACQKLKTYHKNKAKYLCIICFLFDKLRNRKDYIFSNYDTVILGWLRYIHPFHKAFLRLICILSKKSILFYCLMSVHRY